MATREAKRVLRIRGQITWNPTDLTTAFPHGGTGIGLTRDAKFRTSARITTVDAEEYGGSPARAIWEGSDARLEVLLRDLNDDAINLLLPDSFAGSNRRVIRSAVGGAGVRLPGSGLEGKAGVMVVSPDNQESDPFLVFHNAIPIIGPDALIDLGTNRESNLEMHFLAAWTTAGDQWQFGRRRDVTL